MSGEGHGVEEVAVSFSIVLSKPRAETMGLVLAF